MDDEPLTDADDTVDVIVKDSSGAEVPGKLPFNYLIGYGDGDAKSCLQLDDYATSDSDPPGSWVLVAVPPSVGKGKGKAPAAAGKAKAAAAMSTEELEALLAQRRAGEEEEEEE